MHTFIADQQRRNNNYYTVPTISLGSHQNIGLHTGARANVVLLT